MLNKIHLVWILACTLVACGGSGSEKQNVVDITPDAFVLVNIDDSERNVEHQTNEVIVAGLGEPATLTVTGCSYRINLNEQFISESALVDNGDIVLFQLTAPAEYGSTSHCSIALGDYSTSFSVNTKQLIGSVDFYYAGPKYFNPEFNAEKSNVVKVYTHTKDGLEVSAYDHYSEGKILFFEEMPEAYTALSSEVLEDEILINAWTYIGDELEQVVYLDRRPLDYYHYERGSNSECKELEFVSAVEGDLKESVSRYEYTGSGACDNYSGLITTSDVRRREFKEYTDSRNNALVSMLDNSRNIIAYDIFSTDDYIDGDELLLNGFNKDFITASIDGSLNLETQINLWGFSGSVDGSRFKIGSYRLQPNEAYSYMNIIDLSLDEYVLSQYSDIKTEESDYFQTYFISQVIEDIPSNIAAREQSGLLKNVEIKYGNTIQVTWFGEGLEAYDQVEVRLEGESVLDYQVRWVITGKNTGIIDVPYIQNLESFDFEKGVSFRLRLIDTSDSNILNTSLNTRTTLTCTADECVETMTF